jgi:glycerate-2-kinase
MLELVGRPTEDTLVIALISGGGSAMLPLPREGVSLESKIAVTRGLLLGGANIRELNIVRKHISALKGGWLAKLLYPSRVVSLVISDVVGNSLDSIASGPLYPDSSTFLDVTQVLRRYDLTDKIPEDVKKVVREGIEGKIPDTPKPGTKYFRRVTNFVIGSNEDACDAAAAKLRSRNCRPVVLTTSYEGEARSVGTFFGSIVRHGALAKRQKGYVAGGEATVTVRGPGRGGRNQEMVLGVAKKIAGVRGVALVSIGSDGIDGSSDAAGAISDGYTVERLARLRADPDEAFLQNDTHPLFEKLEDLVVTGPTGTNVNDISVAVLR